MNWSLLALLRFVLAFIVACSHAIYFEKDPFALFMASLGAKSAVVGFLLVSGFSIAASLSNSPEGFYYRRFKRIYPVYLCTVVVGIFLEFHYGAFDAPFYQFTPTGIASAIGSVLMLQTFLVKSIAFNPVIWSLAVECSFYLISPFILRRPAVIMLMCLVSVAFYLLPGGDHGLLYTLALKANAIKYFWPFGFGLLLYQNRVDKMIVTAAACLIVGSVAVYLSPINYERFAVATYIASVAAIIFATRTEGRSALMDYLGNVSYPLYLAQFPVFIVLYKVFGITDTRLMLAAAIITSIGLFELIDLRLKRLIFHSRHRTQAAVVPG
jgi:peptidoglycan/LPS O-acetylase OafA/YrhL